MCTVMLSGPCISILKRGTCYVDPVKDNSPGVAITPVSFKAFMDDQEALLAGVDHVVVSGKLEVIKRIPTTVGYIKTSRITIETDRELEVVIDNAQVTQTPQHCEAIHHAVRINVGDSIHDNGTSMKPGQEKITIGNLPVGKELLKTRANITYIP